MPFPGCLASASGVGRWGQLKQSSQQVYIHTYIHTYIHACMHVDVYSSLMLRLGGFTFDVARNSSWVRELWGHRSGMMAKMDGWARAHRVRLRFDRFWIKVRNYAAASIELLDEPVEGKAVTFDLFIREIYLSM